MADEMTAKTEVTAEQPERTFTQAELDAIVGDRLKRERAKYSDYEDLKAKASAYDAAEEASKTDLQKATERANELQSQLDALTRANQERDLREQIAKETGVPASLLRGGNEDDLRAQAEGIKGFVTASKASYPTVRDGGETSTPSITREQILSIKSEKERLKAIRENIELFK